MNQHRLLSGFVMLLVSITIFSFGLSANNISVVQTMSGIFSTSLMPVVEVLFAFLCLYGAGYLVTLFLLKKDDKALLHSLEFTYLCVLLGAVLVSGLLFLLGIASLLRPEIILLLKVIFSLVGGLALVRIPADTRNIGQKLRTPSYIVEKIFQATISFFVLLILFGATSSPTVFVDAMAYHFGLPWLFLQDHAIRFYPTNAGSGQYLAGDLLYLLTLHSDDPWHIFSTKLFNASLEAFIFVAIFLSVRRNGASRVYAYAASILLLSVPAIYLWGTGKNDLFIAGLCLSVFWMFRIYEANRSDVWLYCMFLLGGFAVSVNVTIGDRPLLISAH